LLGFLTIFALSKISKMNEKLKYKPIACSLHDLLLEKATLGTISRIKFTKDRVQHIVNAKIIDVYSKNKAEFMQLDNGKVVRLDTIISIDNTVF